MIHELKILPMFFEAVISGKKTFEIRKADRPYKVGDLLALNEYDNGYTGNSCIVYIDYILNDKVFCRDGYVTMSIKPCAVWRQDIPFDHHALKYDYSVPYATRRSEDNDVFDAAETAPAADVVEVRRGEWVEGAEHFTNGFYEAECSECGNYIRWNEGNSGEWNYCPNCGAKMDGKGEG